MLSGNKQDFARLISGVITFSINFSVSSPHSSLIVCISPTVLDPLVNGLGLLHEYVQLKYQRDIK